MIKVTIIDHAGKPISPQDVSTAAELNEAVEQARNLIRDCDRVARLKAPPARHGSGGGVPYLT